MTRVESSGTALHCTVEWSAKSAIKTPEPLEEVNSVTLAKIALTGSVGLDAVQPVHRVARLVAGGPRLAFT